MKVVIITVITVSVFSILYFLVPRDYLSVFNSLNVILSLIGLSVVVSLYSIGVVLHKGLRKLRIDIYTYLDEIKNELKKRK